MSHVDEKADRFASWRTLPAIYTVPTTMKPTSQERRRGSGGVVPSSLSSAYSMLRSPTRKSFGSSLRQRRSRSVGGSSSRRTNSSRKAEGTPACDDGKRLLGVSRTRSGSHTGSLKRISSRGFFLFRRRSSGGAYFSPTTDASRSFSEEDCNDAPDPSIEQHSGTFSPFDPEPTLRMTPEGVVLGRQGQISPTTISWLALSTRRRSTGSRCSSAAAERDRLSPVRRRSEVLLRRAESDLLPTVLEVSEVASSSCQEEATVENDNDIATKGPEASPSTDGIGRFDSGCDALQSHILDVVEDRFSGDDNHDPSQLAVQQLGHSPLRSTSSGLFLAIPIHQQELIDQLNDDPVENCKQSASGVFVEKRRLTTPSPRLVTRYQDKKDDDDDDDISEEMRKMEEVERQLQALEEQQIPCSFSTDELADTFAESFLDRLDAVAHEYGMDAAAADIERRIGEGEEGDDFDDDEMGNEAEEEGSDKGSSRGEEDSEEDGVSARTSSWNSSCSNISDESQDEETNISKVLFPPQLPPPPSNVPPSRSRSRDREVPEQQQITSNSLLLDTSSKDAGSFSNVVEAEVGAEENDAAEQYRNSTLGRLACCTCLPCFPGMPNLAVDDDAVTVTAPTPRPHDVGVGGHDDLSSAIVMKNSEDDDGTSCYYSYDREERAYASTSLAITRLSISHQLSSG